MSLFLKSILTFRKNEVTVIISTYNRCKSLRRAIRSVLAQSFKNWRILVIGDKCTDDSEAVVASFKSDRINMINLPERFGEQAGPNSIGVLLSNTKYIAFLNHDDIWLPNHLELAINTLEQKNLDIVWGRAAFFSNRGPREDLFFFNELSLRERSLEEAMDAPFYYCEPMSSWVCVADAIKKIAPFKLASEIDIFPIQFIVQEAFKSSMKVSSIEKITVLKDNMHVIKIALDDKRTQYEVDYSDIESWMKSIEDGNFTELIDTIFEDIKMSASLGLGRLHKPSSLKNGHSNAALFRVSGLNIHTLNARSSGKNFSLLSDALRYRTGQELYVQPSIHDVLQTIKGQLKEI